MRRTGRRSSGANQSCTKWRPGVHEKGPFRCPSLITRRVRVRRRRRQCHPRAPPQQRRKRPPQPAGTKGRTESSSTSSGVLWTTHAHAHRTGSPLFPPENVLAGTCIAQEGSEPASARGGVESLESHAAPPFGVVPGVCGKWELTNVRRQCPESRARRQATGVRPGCCECARRRSWDFANADEHGACCSL
jgi:hypothetical protein